GVLGVGSATRHRFAEEAVHLLRLVGDRVATAVDRARLYAAERDARRRAEEALARASERAAQLHTILETMADGVVVLGQDGGRIQMNRTYRELLALERAPAGFEALSPVERTRLLSIRDAATGAPFSDEDAP